MGSTATLGVPQLSPHTLFPDTAGPTRVENVVKEDQCVLAMLGTDCAMLKIQ